MDRKAAESDQGEETYGQGRYCAEIPTDLSFEELRNKFDTSAMSQATRREIASKPSTHDSAMRQVVSGKIFKKCKSATFQIDGATYTIGEFTV